MSNGVCKNWVRNALQTGNVLHGAPAQMANKQKLVQTLTTAELQPANQQNLKRAQPSPQSPLPLPTAVKHGNREKPTALHGPQLESAMLLFNCIRVLITWFLI